MAIAVGSRAVMGAIHRPATSDDAVRLFEIRRQSIRDLARAAMTVEQVDAWAARLSPAGMELKLRELEIWVAEFDGTVVGWGAIRGDYLEALYILPEFAGPGCWCRIACDARRPDAGTRFSDGLRGSQFKRAGILPSKRLSGGRSANPRRGVANCETASIAASSGVHRQSRG